MHHTKTIFRIIEKPVHANADKNNSDQVGQLQSMNEGTKPKAHDSAPIHKYVHGGNTMHALGQKTNSEYKNHEKHGHRFAGRMRPRHKVTPGYREHGNEPAKGAYGLDFKPTGYRDSKRGGGDYARGNLRTKHVGKAHAHNSVDAHQHHGGDAPGSYSYHKHEGGKTYGFGPAGQSHPAHSGGPYSSHGHFDDAFHEPVSGLDLRGHDNRNKFPDLIVREPKGHHHNDKFPDVVTRNHNGIGRPWGGGGYRVRENAVDTSNFNELISTIPPHLKGFLQSSTNRNSSPGDSLNGMSSISLATSPQVVKNVYYTLDPVVPFDDVTQRPKSNV